ncbi:MAG: DNA-directed RNA polymerase subunit omega [Sphingobacteriales bacterium]|jgi:DNA-directed RNA polymerase subunit K/omega|nr:DNA-directed RNA polymerase subunit omega [Sphingobacteriales bacterium]MBP9140210.1 DNA-directed RNA polymerase subunit omega [Chitinophagales bacterium]MDA0197656.1 DNA-directed RNA polymerase subunit omega [Bacteroidota bacterium]MBK6888985.1 DNA-directed RNA polymerase subunit omega [Sphingobacteriales bacterium]MBK7528513.1 DNA-directed RNA polymerase subunit omega [Sphingobacteriales bacterium]
MSNLPKKKQQNNQNATHISNYGKKKKFIIAPNIEPRDLNSLHEITGNTYQTIAIVGKRANQIAATLKEELHEKIEDFVSATDTLEEVHENKEQIEISRVYEKMPHATLLALEELMEDKIYFRMEEPVIEKTEQ